MQSCPDTVHPSSLAPPVRALFEAQHAALEELRADNAALTERNRHLERQDGASVVEELRAELASLADRNRRLEHLVRELRRLVYGKKSEKLHPDQLQLAFEALEGAVAELEQSVPENTTSAPGRKRRAPERNLGHLPEHLHRFEQVIEPESTHCPCGCGEMVRIGEDRTERLDIVPAKLRVRTRASGHWHHSRNDCARCGRGCAG